MARFYGSLQGRRGEATRLGDGVSGLRVEACCWNGKLVVNLGTDDENKGRKDEVKRDVVTIRADTHGSSRNPTGYVFSGTFEELGQLISWWRRKDEINAVMALLGDHTVNDIAAMNSVRGA
jgi:hypothetical protein